MYHATPYQDKPIKIATTNALDIARNQKQYLFHKIMLTTWIYSVVYCCVYYNLHAYISSLANFLSAVILFPITYYLDKRKFHIQARIFLVTWVTFVIAFTSFGLAHKIGAEYYFLTIIMLALFLFEPFNKKAIFFCSLLPFLGWLSMEIVPISDDQIKYIPQDFPYKIFSAFNFIGAFTITFLIIYLYAKSLRQLNKTTLENEYKLMQVAKMASLGELAIGIAHEINNPLSIITGRTQILKQKLEDLQSGTIDPAIFMLNLKKIEDTASHIAKIVKGLSSYSRNTEQDPMLETSFNKIIEYTLELCQERFKNESIKLRISYNADVEIKCHDSQIAQVLMNLIGNALDAIASQPEKWIDISVTASRTEVSFAIMDSGKGISPMIADKIMQPFFTTKEAGKGIGLGLSISKGIIEEHNGTLKYDDTSANTRFILELPRGKPT